MRMFLFVTLSIIFAPFQLFGAGVPYLIGETVPGTADSQPRNLSAGSQLIFWFDEIDSTRHALWRSAGQPGDATQIAELTKWKGAVGPLENVAFPQLDNVLFFPSNRSELWKSDGTPEGTVFVADPNPATENDCPTALTSFGGLIYFLSEGDLWKSDGTSEGTVMVADTTQGTSLSCTEMFAAGDVLLFDTCTTPSAVWISDGTTEGTTAVKSPAMISYFRRAGEKSFVTISADGSESLYVIAPNHTLTEVTPVPAQTFLTSADDVVLFTKYIDSKWTIWRSDGTEQGTFLVTDTLAQWGFSSEQAAYFSWDGSIWSTDGTERGTNRLATVDGTEGGSYFIKTSHGEVFFSVYYEPGFWTLAGPAHEPVEATPGIGIGYMAIDPFQRSSLFFGRTPETGIELFGMANGPSITQMRPSRTPAGGGATITIEGLDVGSASDIFVDGVSCAPTVVDNDRITFTAPPHDAGRGRVVVRLGDGTELPAHTDLIYVGATFELHGISPTSGPAGGGTAVQIAGSSILPSPLVRFRFDSATVTASSSTTITTTTPALPAGTLGDVAVENLDGQRAVLKNAFFVDFLDVPASDPFHASVERIFRAGLTAGCGAGFFCPANPITRAQAAVFLLSAKYGPTYSPPPATGEVFVDVPADSFAAAWIEQLAREGITGGCGSSMFCPGAALSRAQMAVLLLRGRNGEGWAPAPATGTIFDDVPADSFAAAWIEELSRAGITAGCAPRLFCPSNSVTRAQMAAFISAAFVLAQ